jgi:hypothetical protein
MDVKKDPENCFSRSNFLLKIFTLFLDSPWLKSGVSTEPWEDDRECEFEDNRECEKTFHFIPTRSRQKFSKRIYMGNLAQGIYIVSIIQMAWAI